MNLPEVLNFTTRVWIQTGIDLTIDLVEIKLILSAQIWIDVLQQILSRFWSFIWHRSTRCCTKAASFQTLQPGVFLKKMQLSDTNIITTTYSFDIGHQDRLTNKLVLGTPSAGFLGGWAAIFLDPHYLSEQYLKRLFYRAAFFLHQEQLWREQFHRKHLRAKQQQQSSNPIDEKARAETEQPGRE